MTTDSVAKNPSRTLRESVLLAGPVAGLLVASRLWAASPTIELVSPVVDSPNSAQLTAVVRPNGLPTTVRFDWGSSTNLGRVTSSTNVGSGVMSVAVSVAATGLVAGQTYWFRGMATNSAGVTTLDGPPFTLNFAPHEWNAGPSPPGFFNGDVAWGDYDSDGNPDLVILGSLSDFRIQAGIYRNLGPNPDGYRFTAGASLPNVRAGTAAWGDFDHDADLDLFLCGWTETNSFSAVLRNDGQGNFTDINAGLTNCRLGSWGDYDNDGDLDLLVAGLYVTNGVDIRFTRVYENVRGRFSWDPNLVLPGVDEGSVMWGDYDRDGDNDILVAGDPIYSSQPPYLTEIYENLGGKRFRHFDAGLPGITMGEAVWGDYDGDGDLDIALFGLVRVDPFDPVTRIYENYGGSFRWNTNISLPGLTTGRVRWADFDNNGHLDLFLCGQILAGTTISRIYRNTGRGAFVEVDDGLLGVQAAGVASGDLDADGDLDLLLSGVTTAGSAAARVSAVTLYRNLTAPTNAPPSAPGNLESRVSGASVRLEWSAARDRETTNQSSLTYNLRVGATPGGSEVTSAQAILDTGKRLVFQSGNAGAKTNAFLTHLVGRTTYYWSVQAIDLAFAGSPFAVEQSFSTPDLPPIVVTLPATNIAPTRATLMGTVHPEQLLTTAWFEWGTTTNYGQQTLPLLVAPGAVEEVVSSLQGQLIPGASYHFRIVATNSAGRTDGSDQWFVPPQFTLLMSGIPPVQGGAAAWGDFDGDRDLDLVLAGKTNGPSSFVRLGVNEGTGSFAVGTAGLPALAQAQLAWGDYDNDNDLDLYYAGSNSTSFVSRIYRNEGRAVFVDSMAGLANGRPVNAVSWGDFDNDGDLDLAIAESPKESGAAAVTRLYRNDDSVFHVLNVLLPGVPFGSIGWGDYDNDGDLDLILAGGSAAGSPVCRIYRNDGQAGFVEHPFAFPTSAANSAAWGDYDGDGNLDVLLAGSQGSSLFRNDGRGSFEETRIVLAPGVVGMASWADYDNDGDLDVLINDSTNSPFTGARLYQNNGDHTFSSVADELLSAMRSNAAWGDMDNDGDLDLFFAGAQQLNPPGVQSSAFLRNNCGAPNHPPSAPRGLSSAVHGVGVRLAWTAATDIETTNSAALTYNLSVGTTPNGTDVAAPQADLVSGHRWLPQFGNAQHGFTAMLTNLAARTTYYWRVQAIDTAYAGSPFSEEGSFTTGESPPAVITLPASRVVTPEADLHGAVIPFGLETVVWFEWGLDTNYGNRTVVTNVGAGRSAMSIELPLDSLHAEKTYHFRLVATNAAGRSEGSDQSFATPLFTVLEIPLHGAYFCQVAWADQDNDGDLDLLVTGDIAIDGYLAKRTGVYRNDGGGGFAWVAASSVASGEDVNWWDLDNDGYLDVSIGVANYRNIGPPSYGFTLVGSNGLSPLVLGDFDNDGDQDFVAGTGNPLLGQINSTIWRRNQGAGSFMAVNLGDLGAMQKVAGGPVDIDGDGDDDFWTASGFYENRGNGTFLRHDIGMPALRFGMGAWGDYDNDGDPDLLTTGTRNGATITAMSRLYRNDGNWTFTDVNAPLPAVGFSSTGWGDFDNDGDLDIALAGSYFDGVTDVHVTRIYRNQGQDHFVDIQAPALTPIYRGAVAWGDYDNDGDLDLVVSGLGTGIGLLTRIYRNNGSVSNTPPMAPSGLGSSVFGNSVRLSWIAAVDRETTPTAGLSYNLRVGSRLGGVDIVSPASDASTGYRRLPRRGNVQQGESCWLTNLPPGMTIYWSVQAVDTAYAGSQFATEQVFFTQPLPPIAVTLPATNVTAPVTTLVGSLVAGADSAKAWFEWGPGTNFSMRTAPVSIARGVRTQAVFMNITGLMAGVVYGARLVATNEIGVSIGANVSFVPPTFLPVEVGLPGCSRASGMWADWDGDGHLDLALAGLFGNSRALRVYRNEGNGGFLLHRSLPGGDDGAVAWGDIIDNDGDLDLLGTGSTTGLPTGGASRIHRNRLSEFESIDFGLPAVVRSAVAMADIDQDGDLDIFVGGIAGSQRFSRIFRNDRIRGIIASSFPFPGIEEGAATWADLDRDGRPDLVLTGTTNGTSTGGMSRVYLNQGGGVFTALDVGLPPLWRSAVATADFDNDGDVDLALAGASGGQRMTRVYRNLGNLSFADVGASLVGVEDGALSWGDYDSDGYADLAVMGSTNGLASGAMAVVYRGSATGQFVNVGDPLPGVWRGVVTWGDYDRDDDLDLLMAGETTATNAMARVLRNDGGKRNEAPRTPQGLQAIARGGSIEFGWAPAVDQETPVAGLNYNVRVGKSPGGGEIVPSHSLGETGRRQLTDWGNVQQRTSVIVTNLPADTLFYWAVQSIDGGLAGSPFATEQEAYVGRTRIVRISIEAGTPPALLIGGPSGFEYVVQTSMDLVNWTDRAVVAIGQNGVTEFTDGPPTADNGNSRFYRLREP